MKRVFDPIKAKHSLHTITLSSVLTLTACGGGGGGLAAVVGSPTIGGGAGIGGTGLTSTGTIDGTGSIFVNGVRFDVDDADILIDGQPASEDDLGLGMVVTVTGTVDEDGVSGAADEVTVTPRLEGPLSAIERDADNNSARLTILGQTVIAERTSTVFEDVRFETLAPGDDLEVFGYTDNEGRIRATRIERDDDGDTVEVSGTINGLSGSAFLIGKQQIDASTAQLDDLPDGLANGLFVTVEGELRDDTVFASEIEGRATLPLQEGDRITLQGAINDYAGIGSFTVEGLGVDASSATLDIGDTSLRNGAVVEIEGSWNGTLVIASRVTSRRGRIKLEAPVSDVSAASGMLTLQYAQGTVTVTTDDRTLFDDDRDGLEYPSLDDLAIGDFVEIEALTLGGTLLATRIDRDDDDDDLELQAPVQGFVEGESIDLLGLTFNVSNAEFENAGDDDISAAAFFANLTLGALVRVVDDEPADGFAEDVEFEFSAALDGDREFPDDDEERIDPDALPQAAVDYLAANYPAADIAFIERDDDEIEVYLTDGTEVVFDLDGNFLESDLDDDDEDDDDSDGDDDGDGDSDDSEDEDDEATTTTTATTKTKTKTKTTTTKPTTTTTATTTTATTKTTTAMTKPTTTTTATTKTKTATTKPTTTTTRTTGTTTQAMMRTTRTTRATTQAMMRTTADTAFGGARSGGTKRRPHPARGVSSRSAAPAHPGPSAGTAHARGNSPAN
jgi:hypothetical protein